MSDPYRKPDERAAAEAANPARPWELRTWTSERYCPVCDVALFAAEKDGYRIDACGACGGSWMSHANAKKMIDSAAKTPIELAKITESIVPRASTENVRRCPDCRQALERDVVAEVVVDVCDEHGTWFDPRELEQVAVALIRDYGPAAKQAAIDAEDAERAAKEAGRIDPLRVAAGVASLSLSLLGAAVGPPPVETDILGNVIKRR
jgi:Zn-finger nucleic acid-binding protein